MAILTTDQLFDAAVRILLNDERCVTISLSQGHTAIRFPTTRKLAKELDTPHYYVLPLFAEMEQDGLIRRIERVGISTTNAGSSRMLELMHQQYREKAEEIIGADVFRDILTLTKSMI